MEESKAKETYSYFVDNTKYDSVEQSLTGAQIKARIAGFNPTYALYEEGHGKEKDILIKDDTTVDLEKTEGGPKRFITVPPATFGV